MATFHPSETKCLWVMASSTCIGKYCAQKTSMAPTTATSKNSSVLFLNLLFCGNGFVFNDVGWPIPNISSNSTNVLSDNTN